MIKQNETVGSWSDDEWDLYLAWVRAGGFAISSFSDYAIEHGHLYGITWEDDSKSKKEKTMSKKSTKGPKAMSELFNLSGGKVEEATTVKKAANEQATKARPSAKAKGKKTTEPEPEPEPTSNGKAKGKGGKAAPAKAAAVEQPAEKPKANTAPKSKPMPEGRSVHADEPIREPKWEGGVGDRRVAIVMAMRELGAVSPNSAVTAQAIGEQCGVVGDVDLSERVDLVKVALDVYRTGELIHNKFAASTRTEGERGLTYYLLPKGQVTEFPTDGSETEEPDEVPAKKAKAKGKGKK